MCRLPLDNFVVDLEHLLPGSQSKVPEPVSGGQTNLYPIFLMWAFKESLCDVLILPASRTEEHGFIPSVELPQLTEHLLSEAKSGEPDAPYPSSSDQQESSTGSS